ncbi:hypothetical protein AGMMS49938_18930 [Fibrobacterales bacterium]|nr:hypothetical protein AGMMS49938_18930 [Fibrobacterales bacterium]
MNNKVIPEELHKTSSHKAMSSSEPTKCYFAISHCTESDFDLVSYNLFESGVTTIEELNVGDLAKSGSGGDLADSGSVAFKFYSPTQEERDRIVAEHPNLNFECGEEESRDWDLWWRERQTPVKVSENLWVRPPWVEFSEPSAVVLALEAKTAFGTGEHDSTALTAQLMEFINLSGKKLLDIGTGTGILSLFALKRGAKLAIGTEIDPLTIDCIVENFQQNGENKNAVLGFLDVFNENAKFDVIVCNMIRTEFFPLREEIRRLLKGGCGTATEDGGYFILSGQLADEKHYILDWLSEVSWRVVAEKTSGEWWAVLAKK